MSEHNLTNFQSLIKQKRVVKKVPKGALLAMGVPNKSSVSEYRPAGILMRDLLNEIGSSLPPTPTEDTAKMAGVVFISPSGNNGTGTIGDMNKPYSTVAAAVQSNPTVSYIILLPGNYSESIYLKADTTYYCYPGVNFTFGGIRNTDGVSFSNARWLGYAKFTGSGIIRISDNSVISTGVYIEFDYTDVTNDSYVAVEVQLYAPEVNGVRSNVNIHCNHIEATGGNGYTVRFRGILNATLNVKDYIKGNYGVVRLRTFTRGVIEIHCPKLIMPDSGFVGNHGSYKHILALEYCEVGTELIVHGDLHSETTVNPGSISGCISVHGGVGAITHYGNIYAGSSRPVYCNSPIEIRQIGGHVYGSETSILTKGSLTFMNGHINDITLSGVAKMYMKNATVEGTLDLSTTTEEVVILNTTIKSTGANSITADTPKTNVTMKKVLSNKPTNNITNTLAAGFTEDAGLDNIDISKF